MRIREVVALVVLVVPAGAHAQRLPFPGSGRRGPAQPVPLSPTPAPIARQMVYRRLPISVESYPLISHVEAPGLNGVGNTAAWTSLGAGTRLEYRLTPILSATADLTSSLPGSPLLVQTAELGTRIGPERSERRLYPFLDVRGAYIAAYNGELGSAAADQFVGSVTPNAYGPQYSHGFGGVVGVGMEYAVTSTLSLTTAGSVMRSRLTPHDFTATNGVSSFGMTEYRYTIGLKYNPVRRMVMPAFGDLR